MARQTQDEFSPLCRNKFTSMPTLFELRNQPRNKFEYKCNDCEADLETRYHCTVCDDFDLCIQCYENTQHPHKMEKREFGHNDASPPTHPEPANPKETPKPPNESCMQSLVHVSQCRDANCQLSSCPKMKRIVVHMKNCPRKTNGGCPICIQVIGLCCCHAKFCTENKCPVPFCDHIKHKMGRQRFQNRLQQLNLAKRRMPPVPAAASPDEASPGPSGETCPDATSSATDTASANPKDNLASPRTPRFRSKRHKRTTSF